MDRGRLVCWYGVVAGTRVDVTECFDIGGEGNGNGQEGNDSGDMSES